MYRQHIRYLDKHGDSRSPREAMLQDLCNDIQRWQESGDQIVLMMDANEDVALLQQHPLFCEVGLTEAMRWVQPINVVRALLMAFSCPQLFIFSLGGISRLALFLLIIAYYGSLLSSQPLLAT